MSGTVRETVPLTVTRLLFLSNARRRTVIARNGGLVLSQLLYVDFTVSLFDTSHLPGLLTNQSCPKHVQMKGFRAHQLLNLNLTKLAHTNLSCYELHVYTIFHRESFGL